MTEGQLVLWGTLVAGLFMAGGLGRLLLRLGLTGQPSTARRRWYNVAATVQAAAITSAIGMLAVHIWLNAMQKEVARHTEPAAIAVAALALLVGYYARKQFKERLERSSKTK